ncbi:MAG: hypothetical protein ACJ8DQ_20855 [Xanthobacteraceae bacterium]
MRRLACVLFLTVNWKARPRPCLLGICVRAYGRIPDKRLRRAVVALVERLARDRGR